MGGKASAPPAPDYSAIASADAKAADNQYQLGQQQLQWGKDQFNTIWPYAQQYMQQQTTSSAANTAEAQKQQDYYDTTYKPLETQFAGEASTWNSPARAQANAGAAEADVASAYDANRSSALSNLESYGIDPSQTRFGALDLGTRVSQAAATAAAGTQSNLNTQATGLALQGEGINIGRGYPGAIAQSYGTATAAGGAGISAANSSFGTGASAMGSPTSYMGLGNDSMRNQTSALNTGFQNQMAGAQFNAQQSADTSQGIGKLIGGGLGLAAAFV